MVALCTHKQIKDTWYCYWDSLGAVLKALKVPQEELYVDQRSRENWHACKRRHERLTACRKAEVDLGLDVSSRFAPEYQPLPYQLIAGQQCYVVGQMLNADAVGMGKTMASWTTAEIIQREHGQCKTIVLCLSSLKRQWKAELSAYTNGRIKAKIVEGTPKQRHAVYQKFAEVRGTCVMILNYEQVLRDQKEIVAAMGTADYIIADEASRLKNRNAKTTKVLKSVSRMVPWKCALTATPIEVGVENLYSIMEWLDPTMLGTLTLYRGAYTRVHWIKLKNGKKVPKVLGFKNLADLRARTSSRRVRRTPADVGNQMPELRAQVVWVEMGEHQFNVYESAKAGVLRALEEDQHANPMVIAGDALRACLSPSLVGRKGVGVKTEYVRDLLTDEAADERALVFCESKTYLRDELLPVLKKAGVDCALLCGDTSLDDRRAMQRAFVSDSLRVLLMTSAGERGLNLPCGLVIDVDLLWNPSRLTQRAGRARRLKSGFDSVRVLNVLTRSTAEEKVLSRVLGRRSLSEAVVGKEESDPVGVLSADDWADMFV